MRLLDACARRPVDTTPVWLMRQAGRYLPEYRALRERLPFIEMCRRPDVAAEVTLQPLRRFDLDGAIVFADILLPLEPMGVGFRFTADDGPVIDRPIRSVSDLARVRAVDLAAELDYVLETVRLVRRELDGRVPVIGFAGAPFTLASYLVEGGRSRAYTHVKAFMYHEPVAFGRLLELLATAVADYLAAQVSSGAQVVQVFDSWVGWLSPYDYEVLVLPHVRALLENVRACGVPVVYFASGAGGMLHHVARAGADVVAIDWRVDLDRAWRTLGDVAVQGNLDPAALLGPPAVVEERVADILRRAGGRPGHVFNLGHGVLPQTPPEHVALLVDTVHRLGTRVGVSPLTKDAAT